MDKPETKILRDILSTLGRIEALLRAQAQEDGLDVECCPQCQGTDLIEASAMGSERMICRNCSAVLMKETVNG